LKGKRRSITIQASFGEKAKKNIFGDGIDSLVLREKTSCSNEMTCQFK